MKKILSMMLACFLCLAMAFPVFANQKNSELVAQLILSAKAKLAISDEKFVFSDYYQSESEYGKRYNLSWKSKDEITSESVHVEMSEEGTIFYYNFYDGSKEYGKPKYPEKSEKEALEAVKNYLAVIDAEKAAQMAEGNITYDSYKHSYHYNAERILDSIPVFGEGISVQLDADTLKLTHYRADWTEGLTSSEENLLSFDEAVEAYRKKLGYELFYQVASEEFQDTVKLVYRPTYDEGLYIDAISGEVVSFADIMTGGTGGIARNEASSALKDAAALSPEEQVMVDEIKNMLSKEKVEQIARSVTEFQITKDYTVDNYSISKNSHGEYIGRISFRMETNQQYGYRNVSINLKTSEVVGYNGYSYSEDGSAKKTKKLTVEQGQQLAEKFLKKYYPNRYEKMTMKTVFEPLGDTVCYQRVENGVKVYNNGANLSFDAETGAISSFRLEWTDAEIPQISAVDLQKVYEKLLTVDNFRCGYLLSYDGDSKKPFVKAVYQVEQQPIYDIEKVQELDWRLHPIAESKKQEYGDIAGHYAEEIIKKLDIMGIYYPGSMLRPNEAVMQKEYLKLIAQVLYQRTIDDDEELYQEMLRCGVLTKEEINSDVAITRIEAIRYLINAMGYREFAQIPGIFHCPFADVSEADKGYGAIAAGLKLVHSQTETFYADDLLRRADSLIIIYNYLSR